MEVFFNHWFYQHFWEVWWFLGFKMRLVLLNIIFIAGKHSTKRNKKILFLVASWICRRLAEECGANHWRTCFPPCLKVLENPSPWRFWTQPLLPVFATEQQWTWSLWGEWPVLGTSRVLPPEASGPDQVLCSLALQTGQSHLKHDQPQTWNKQNSKYEHWTPKTRKVLLKFIYIVNTHKAHWMIQNKWILYIELTEFIFAAEI